MWELIPEPPVDHIERIVLDGLRSLFDEDLIVFGDLVSGGVFEPWPEQSNALARVTREWRSLGHDPNPGEVFWIELTGKGEEVARDLAADG